MPAAPRPLPWPDASTAETIEPNLGTNQLAQTRGHFVWREGVPGPQHASHVRVHLVALDKKTLAKTILFTDRVRVARTKQEMIEMGESGRERIWTTAESVFVEQDDVTLRVAPDAAGGAPLRMPKPPGAGATQCADATNLYRSGAVGAISRTSTS